MDEYEIKNEIEQGIAQVDDTLTITEFSCTVDKEKRHRSVYFKAEDTNGETIEIINSWG